MKNIVFISSLLLFCSCSYAQVINIQWQKSYGGSNADAAYGICQTSSGYMVTGPAASHDSEVTGAHGGYDYWAVKVTPTGGIIWQHALGGSTDDIPAAVLPTELGGYILAGGTESTDGDVTGFIGAEYDYWLVRLDSNGNTLWKTCYGGSAFNEAKSIWATTSGGYIVAGESYSSDSEVTGHHGINNSDYWVIKVNDTGALIWAKCYGGTLLDAAESIQQTTDGGYVVAGKSGSTDGDVVGNHGGASDYWVVKLDDTGAIQWQKALGGSGDDEGYAIQQTFDGGYIVVGGSNSIDSEVTGNHGGYDFWIVKLTSTGNIVWQKSLGGTGDDWAYSVQQTSDSGYIVSGGTSSIDGDVTGNHGGNDTWVVKLSKYGNIQWQKALGGSGDESGYSVQQTLDSGYIVAGSSTSNDSEVSGNHGGSDFWVVKLSKCLLSPTISRTGNTISTSAGYTNYQWMLHGNPIAGATNASYMIPGGGQYSVFVTDSNGCSGYSLSDSLTTGLSNITNNSLPITIMPNPTTGNVFINGVDIVNIRIYNLLGMLVKEADKTDNISIAELPSGLYIIKLFNKEGEFIFQDKLIKQ